MPHIPPSSFCFALFLVFLYDFNLITTNSSSPVFYRLITPLLSITSLDNTSIYVDAHQKSPPSPPNKSSPPFTPPKSACRLFRHASLWLIDLTFSRESSGSSRHSCWNIRRLLVSFTGSFAFSLQKRSHKATPAQHGLQEILTIHPGRILLSFFRSFVLLQGKLPALKSHSIPLPNSSMHQSASPLARFLSLAGRFVLSTRGGILCPFFCVKFFLRSNWSKSLFSVSSQQTFVLCYKYLFQRRRNQSRLVTLSGCFVRPAACQKRGETSRKIRCTKNWKKKKETKHLPTAAGPLPFACQPAPSQAMLIYLSAFSFHSFCVLSASASSAVAVKQCLVASLCTNSSVA